MINLITALIVGLIIATPISYFVGSSFGITYIAAVIGVLFSMK